MPYTSQIAENGHQHVFRLTQNRWDDYSSCIQRAPPHTGVVYTIRSRDVLARRYLMGGYLTLTNHANTNKLVDARINEQFRRHHEVDSEFGVNAH